MRRLSNFFKALTLVSIGLVAVPVFAVAAVFTISQGGTALPNPSTGWKAGSILIANDTSAFATSTDFQFSTSLKKLTVTNIQFTLATGTSATTTNLSGTNISGFGLSSCAGATNALTWSGNTFGCNTISAGGGSGTVGTSSAETSGRVPFWTTTGASPALLSGGVAGFAWDNTLSKLTATNISSTLSTSTSATTTNFAVSGIVSVIPLTNAGGSFSAYAGTSCTNQFVRSLSALGAATCNSVAIASDVSGLGSGVATFLGTPSSANLASALTDETGTGLSVFNNTPTEITPIWQSASGVEWGRVVSGGFAGIGTTTPKWLLQLASSTAPQLTLSDPGSASNNHWSFRNIAGVLYIATSSPATFATSSVSAFKLDANGALTLPNLAAAAGTFVAADPNGKLIATSTPGGLSNITSVTANSGACSQSSGATCSVSVNCTSPAIAVGLGVSGMDAAAAVQTFGLDGAQGASFTSFNRAVTSPYSITIRAICIK